MLWKMLKTFDAGWSNRRHFMNGGLGVGCPPVGGFFIRRLPTEGKPVRFDGLASTGCLTVGEGVVGGCIRTDGCCLT